MGKGGCTPGFTRGQELEKKVLTLRFLLESGIKKLIKMHFVGFWAKMRFYPLKSEPFPIYAFEL